jgi:hypothetical protein
VTNPGDSFRSRPTTYPAQYDPTPTESLRLRRIADRLARLGYQLRTDAQGNHVISSPSGAVVTTCYGNFTPSAVCSALEIERAERDMAVAEGGQQR